LWSRPPVHLAEVALVPGLEPDGTTGTLDVEVAVGGDLAGDGSTADGGVRWWVGVSVEHLDGTLVHDAEPVEVTAFDDGEPLTRLLASATWPGQVVRSRIEVPGVDPWSDEAPNRYRSLVRLWRTPAASDDVVGKGADGEGADGNGADHPSDVAAVVTGFRSVCVADQELRINGAVPLIRGVNRHEHDPDRGRFVDPEHTRAELCLAKRLNVNAVRTAHAPAAPWFYDLCTELGLFVVDETNCETHARQQSLLAGPGFTGAVIERGLRMVGRDRNHPCVVVWSLGNEAGEGAAHHALAGAIRHLDPGRPLSYEGPIMFDLEADNPVSDLVAPMYRSVEEITAWAKARRAAGCADRRRPLILCEYSHAMGNSNGGLADYWDAFRAHHGLQGGFVWEWRDHGLLRSGSGSSPQPGDGPVASEETPGRGGDARWGYGGDFGEDRHDGNFVCDGLLAPDLTPHPACVELAHLQRSLHVEADGVSPGRYRLRSERSFTDTADVVGRWRLEADGRAVAEGTVDVPVVAPGGEAELIVPMPDLDRARGGDDHEMALTLELALAAATAWAPAGHVVARHQFRQPRGTSTDGRAEHPRTVASRAPRGVVVNHSGDRWVLGDGAWALEVDRQQGVVGLARHGRQLLVDRPGHSLWRAPVDNDGMKTAWMAGFGHQARWRQLGLDRVDGPETRRIDRVTVRRREGGAVAVLTGALVVAPPADRQDRPAVECPIVERWSMRDDGTISADVTWRLPEELADPPRVGLVLALDPAFDRLESYGLGPHECPPDRVDGAVLSRYVRLAGAERCPYVLPQCFGQRSGTRWLTVTDPDVGTLTIAGDRPYVHTAHRYSEAQLTEALHADELRPEEAVLLHLDAAHRGVGTASCGPDTAERHRVAPGRHRLAVSLSWADVAPA
ncbi:MAG: DUF4981 domain-containing protein, partial [Microthrixaceae bacterium]|nr:DUF4981 domain-containing protein [Microthrixaceae bacterium]